MTAKPNKSYLKKKQKKKNAIREVDWTYYFFTCENIAHIEFYLQGLLLKIFVIYTIEQLFMAFLRTALIALTIHARIMCIWFCPVQIFAQFSTFI